MDWTNAISAGVSIVALVTTIVIYFRQRKVKRLEWKVLTIVPLLAHRDDIVDAIEVRVEGQAVTNLHLFQIRLKNTGNTAIRPEDFASTPLEIQCGVETALVLSIVETVPEQFGQYVRVSVSRPSDETERWAQIWIEPLIINPGNSLTLQLLTEGFPSDIGVIGHLADTRIQESKQGISVRRIWTFLFLSAGALFTLLVGTYLVNTRAGALVPISVVGIIGVFAGFFTSLLADRFGRVR